MTISGFPSSTPLLVMHANYIMRLRGLQTACCFMLLLYERDVANNPDNAVKKIKIWASFNTFSRSSLNYRVGELHSVSSMAVVMKSHSRFQTQGEKIIWMLFIVEHCSRRANPTVHFKQKRRVKKKPEWLHLFWQFEGAKWWVTDRLTSGESNWRTLWGGQHTLARGSTDTHFLSIRC